MMNINFANPTWVNYNLLQFRTLEEVPDSVIQSIKNKMKNLISQKPLVSIVISVWNEEVNIIRCLDSLAMSETSIPFDILVVNNNSTDRTQESLDRLSIPSLFQPIQGCGAAREMGQQNAKGKYILFADADCFYPKLWIDTMMKGLLENGVIFVSGKYSFLGTSKIPRWKMALYEIARDIMVEIKQINTPYLNAYGMSMGYIREYGIKEGYSLQNIRGEDGRLCFDLMKYGRVKLIRSNKAKVWTGARTLEKDGSFYQILKKRVLREMARFDIYLKAPLPHNTKTSENTEYTPSESIKILKKKYNPFRLLRKNNHEN